MITVNGISKSYGSRTVVDDVSFDVIGGRLTGFVGANGAGKTTTMRIMLGVLTPDSGDVRMDGVPMNPDDRRRFGYMPEERGLYPKMKVLEQLVYLARLHGMGKKDAAVRAESLVERLGLAERSGDTIESLSLGNQQRAQVAAALVHDPEVLVLDEPFSGLDPMAVESVLEVLRETAARGVPVLFSSHQLEVVERLCDDVVVISGGTIRAAGSRQDLKARYGERLFRLQLDEPDAAWLADEPGVTVVAVDGAGVLLRLDDPSAAQALLRTAIEHGPVRAFHAEEPALSDIFKEVNR